MKQKTTAFNFFCILTLVSLIMFGIINIIINKQTFELSNKVILFLKNGLITSFILFGICVSLIMVGAIVIIRKESKKNGDQDKRK